MDMQNWTDSDDYTCADYTSFDLCTASGGTGTNWLSDYGTFADYMNMGATAADACCGCGGGQKGVCVCVCMYVCIA